MELFVSNLPFEITEEELKSMFAEFSTLSNIKMLTDRYTGNFRGIAFITIDDLTEANNAISTLNGTDVSGRSLRVEQSRPRENKPQGFNKGKRSFGGNSRPNGNKSRW